MTDKVRKWALFVFVVVCLGALVGWLLERDPSQLYGLLPYVVVGLGIGEGSNVGKRATTKVELMAKPDGA